MTVVIVMMIVRATWWPICLAQSTRQDPTNPKGDTLISKHTTASSKIITIMAIHRPRRAVGMIFYASSAVERVEKKKYQEELNKQLHQKGRL